MPTDHRELDTDLLVVGGGLGGVAAALAALNAGRRVVLTEESPWLGGQLTSQAVPPDEHPWIETQGAPATYRRLRDLIRGQYVRNHPLTEEALRDPTLNPGGGGVSALCHEPRAAVAAIDEMLAPYLSDGQLRVLLRHQPHAVHTTGDRFDSVTLHSKDPEIPSDVEITARYVIDASELGDLLELGGVEHVIGAESRQDTGELHALDGPAEPLDQQSFTWCFALDYLPGQDHTISRPANYAFWRAYTPDFWPGPLLGWEDVWPETLEPRHREILTELDSARGLDKPNDFWFYRRIFTVRQHRPGRYASDVTLVNWPQIDYFEGPVVGVSPAERQRHLDGSRELSLSFLYWMQTEAPRYDGGTGYPGLRPRGDLLGSGDDLALRPYIRESRRLRAEFTVLEDHVGVEARQARGATTAEQFDDSVGVGSYRIDLHPSCGGTRGPHTYIDVASHPFQVPLGALIPQRVENLLAGAKNIGTTHITNGCYRLHPVEWTIGEAAGTLAAHCLDTDTTPRALRNRPSALAAFQQRLVAHGAELAWSPEIRTAVR